MRSIAQRKGVDTKKSSPPQHQTVKELYDSISIRSPVLRIYAETMQVPGGKPPEKIFLKDYFQLFRRLGLEIYEKDMKDSFYLMAKGEQGKTEEKMFVQASELGRRYDEYVAEEENLKGVLNVHVLKTRNYELQLKLQFWKETADQRKELDRSYQQKEEYILSRLKEFAENTLLEKDELTRQSSDFFALLENKRTFAWQLRVLMKFLAGIPLSGILSIKDLKRHLEAVAAQKLATFSLLSSFVQQVRRECALHGQFFSFYDVPDVIIKLRYPQKEYDQAIQFLNRVKSTYLSDKKPSAPQSEAVQPQITDEDLVPLAILEDILGQMREKQRRREDLISSLIFECEDEVAKKREKLNVTNDRIVQPIENNIFIAFLNGYLENMLTEYNLTLFVIKRIFRWLRDPNFVFRAADFLPRFRANLGTAKTDPEFAKLSVSEIDKFNKRTKPVETESSDTSVMEPRARGKKLLGEARSSASMEELAEAIDVLNPVQVEERKAVPKLGAVREMPREEEGIVSLRSEEGKKQLSPEEAQARERFKTSKEGYYNPKEKFGTLEPDYTEYDPHMTKYEAVLPVDHYMKEIDSQTPTKDAPWYLRPHHVESLTRIPLHSETR